MTGTPKGVRSIGAALVLIAGFVTVPGFAVDFVIGAGGGYSLALTERRMGLYGEGTVERLAEPRACLSASLGLSFRGHFSLVAEFHHQWVDAVDRTYPGGEIIATWPNTEPFAYLGLSLEYRLFEDVRKSWNPYFSFGVYGLLWLFGPPEYPSSTSFKMAAGAKIRLTGPLFLNPRVAYYSGMSGLSFQVGLDLIL
jgi:hypothetical protein